MIDASRLLNDLQRLVSELEDDLRERMGEVPKARERLEEQYRDAKAAGRTGEPLEPWRDEFLTQVAVAWVLGCVFIRFMEDNRLVDTPWLSGTGDRRQRALDQHELYFRHPERRTHSDRDYLFATFDQTRALPAAAELFDPKHNPLWAAELSGDGASKLLQFWQRVDPDAGKLDHDFTDPDWNTRFLGDLYQDLSESGRKRYALLQTPEFVEEFILDRTLTPAIDEFGLNEVRLIDPTCGSGHFLLGAFQRLFDLWVTNEPGTNPRALAQRALDQVYGVDLNPFAVAIARFRLLVEALRASGVRSLRVEEAPAFHINVAAGDSLLHGRRFDQLDLGSGAEQLRGQPGIGHAFMAEDLDSLNEVLGQQYHAVVGNPPYITVKDMALNRLYRDRYATCHMKYSLGVPFAERFFGLAEAGDMKRAAGFVGMITANSFMKREFGKKLIEQFFPRVDVTHVIDTSGAFIPGHGTPTVILFGRNRHPIAGEIRTVMGISGEPSTPDDPSRGEVWRSIVERVDQPNTETEFVSVTDYPRARFATHPWSLGGGGSAELKEHLDVLGVSKLGEVAKSIGFASFTGLDDAFVHRQSDLARRGVPKELVRPFVYGESIRDWTIDTKLEALVPYQENLEPLPISSESAWARLLWPLRSSLKGVRSFGGKTREELGDDWWTWYRWIPDKYGTPFFLTFAEVASHNHFVLERGQKVFNQTAPVIKLPSGATEDDHLALLALLNSSTACFWMKQVSHQKQMTGGDGIRVASVAKVPYQYAGRALAGLPIPEAFFDVQMQARFVELGRSLDQLGQEITNCDLQALLIDEVTSAKPNLQRRSEELQNRRRVLRRKSIFLQEELDFAAYVAFGLCTDDVLATHDSHCNEGLEAGMRPFEIHDGKNLDGFPVTDSVPEFSETEPARTWRLRLKLIEEDRNLRIIENSRYKRRWIGRQGLFNHAARLDDLAEECSHWLLRRLETPSYWPDGGLQTVARLGEFAGRDPDFMQIAELYRGHADFNVASLVAELVADESVPFLPVLRYKPSGLRKRAVWERTWSLQRAEDAIDAELEAGLLRLEGEADDAYRDRVTKAAKSRKASDVGDIPPPPKYRSADFLNTTFWRLRGALDVAKERFVSYPSCSPAADASLLVGWAGWNPLQQAQALSAHYLEMKERDGWSPERLTPLLAGLQELLPWVKQWHNDIDPAHGVRMGDYFEDFANEEARELGVTPDQIAAWTPPATGRRGKRKKKAASRQGEIQLP